MFHVKHSDPTPPQTSDGSSRIGGEGVRDSGGPTIPEAIPAVARDVFGDRLDLAARYHEFLATEGIARGLIGPREVPRLWDRHILNCAVIGTAWPEGASVVDVGSGAGLPGIPLAIVRPDLRITLVEPLLRRCVFLEEVIESLGLDVSVRRGRAEERSVIAEVGGADIVTSRAVAPLAKLARWSLPLLREDGWMFAMKGSSAADEVERDRAELSRLGAADIHVSMLGEGTLEEPTYVVAARRTKPARGRNKRG